VVVFTDASLTGWGAGCGGDVPLLLCRGEWPLNTVTHISVLELCTVLKVLLHFSHLVSGRHVLIRTDSGLCK